MACMISRAGDEKEELEAEVRRLRHLQQEAAEQLALQGIDSPVCPWPVSLSLSLHFPTLRLFRADPVLVYMHFDLLPGPQDVFSNLLSTTFRG